MTTPLIIDCQLLQTNAWSRGMGRYILALLGGITDQEEKPRVVLIFSKNLKLEEEKRQLIEAICPFAEFHTLNFFEGLSQYNAVRNKQLLDEFIANHKLLNSVFVQASLFSFDFLPVYPTHTINTCIFYDMIPLKFWDIFYRYYPEAEYFSRFRHLYESDKVFSISNTVKQDLIKYLGFKDEDIVNIDGAEIPNFNKTAEKLKDISTPRNFRYILLPGGDSPHKNMLRAIRGFDIFNAHFGDTYRLLITSFYSDENKQRMRELSPNIELCGNISDNELHELYRHAEIVLFPSLDEGLGLPILEAASYGKKVACSDIPIFRELSDDLFYFFNPLSPESIAQGLLNATIDNDAKIKRYKELSKKFSWKKTAKNMLGASLKKIVPEETDEHSIIVERGESLALLNAIGTDLRRHGTTVNIRLYADLLYEDKRVQDGSTPLFFNHIIETRDVSDAFTKANEGTRHIVYTSQSRYSRALERAGDTVAYIDVTAQEVERRFRDEFHEMSNK